MSVARLDGQRRIEGEGPVTEAVTLRDLAAGSKGWLAQASVEEVRARGVQLGLSFRKGMAEGTNREKGRIWYSLVAGEAYVVQTVHRERPVKHHVVLEDDGTLGWCVDSDVLADWLLLRQGRSLEEDRKKVLEAQAAVEAADPLPPMAGTPQQVSWATQIRRAFIVRCPHRRAQVERKQDAKWWIDHREDLGRLR